MSLKVTYVTLAINLLIDSVDSHSVNEPDQQQPIATDLSDPLYYLKNTLMVVDWIVATQGDLLNKLEHETLARFKSLPADHQALLIRMIMRTQEVFLPSQLDHYAEINAPLPEILPLLEQHKLISINEPLNADQVIRLLNRNQLLMLHNQIGSERLPKSASKQQISDSILAILGRSLRLTDWLPELGAPITANCQALFDRLKLMFFGNLRQSWSEFVVTELGLFQYEPVSIDHTSRAFHHRTDVDQYLELDKILMDQSSTLPDRIEKTQAIEPMSSWLAGRKNRVLFLLARELERQDPQAALTVYSELPIQDAQIRELRVLESQTEFEQCIERVEAYRAQQPTPIADLSFERVVKRSYKKLGIEYTTKVLKTPSEHRLELEKDDNLSVEKQVVAALSDEHNRYYYVENSLLNTLFGLLFWDAIYAPVSGAFFNPFQSHPADLYRRGFADKRTEFINDAFSEIERGSYRNTIVQRAIQKRGVTNSLIRWSIVSDELLETALQLIPAEHLSVIFKRLLSDIRTHRSGFPDLIRFDLEQNEYELIEVKGPGDRLQDNQRLWLDFFIDEQIPCSVCWVSWSHDR